MDLLPFLKELGKMLKRVLPETIQIEFSYSYGSFLVNADPTRLQQVFMNLAVNAADAMPEGGKLHFDLSLLHLNPGQQHPLPQMPPGDWVQIAVIDTGEGITEDILPHVFEPFFTTKPVGSGTGLGLAQVYGIIKQHEGYIDVSSQPGKGTTFTIYLPAQISTEPVEAPQELADQFDGAGIAVLIAEDDEAIREALVALLESQNFQVMAVGNGKEAVKLFEEQAGKFDLLVSDVIMPEMGGFALYNVLKERWPDLKVLFITGHPLEPASQALLEKDKVRLLQKPFSAQDFSKNVGEILGKPG